MVDQIILTEGSDWCSALANTKVKPIKKCPALHGTQQG